jgi:hypothetical protein
MSTWAWFVAAGFLVTGAVLAMGTTTSNKLRWAVMAPAVWGTGMLFIAVMSRDWGPIAVSSGMFFYAAINYRTFRKSAG